MDEAGTEGIEDVAGELLALPPERFTEARNAAAKQLRAEGRKDAAEAVKRLPRPPLALWALNRLAREQAPLVEAFLSAAADLREAYRTGGDIRAATAPEREAESRVAAAAAALARGEGKNVSDAVSGSIAQTLRAAAADEGVAGQLRAGLLLREPAPPSIGDLLGSIPPAPASSSGGRARPAAKAGARGGDEPSAEDGGDEPDAEEAERDERRRDLREQIAAAKADASAQRKEARAATEQAAKLHAEWERAESAAKRAAKRRDATDELLAELQEQLDEL